ncbi:hypothetical protein Poli38472_002235 [Pythium oligandrum]|uniref:Lysosomal dipeptide transporter MFSD1 n=1 Tax=Pythium oligandrum TaxID=41045 RepID=A0A8K1CGU8_PYTOL|nr:hypothetical protein Poli38472_002235 [Pythium oligandrum]|eukprot:TMW63294.1 hypothetical protein Poli38472_002235 [Pythium oligandrum]
MGSLTENTPLVPADKLHKLQSIDPPLLSPLRKAPGWKVWATTSKSHRFFLLVLMSLIPFGGHFVKNGMSALEPLMLEDPDFPMTNTMYGALVSAVSVPNMFIPLYGGRFLDKSGHRSIQFFLIWICIGQAIFAIGMELKLFWLALFGRVFFGVGEGSVVVGARVFIAYWFRNKELTFAMGVGVAITNVSKMLAKSTVAPVALYFGGYVQALWYGVVICVVSFLVGVLCCRYTNRLKKLVTERVQQDAPLDPELHWLKDYADNERRQRQIVMNVNQEQVSCDSVEGFSQLFWTLAILHVIFVTLFHLFQNVSSSFLKERYGFSVVKSGFVSSISHSFVVFAPFIGLFIDQFGGRMYWIVASALLSILAYGLMIFTEVNPVISMVLISICLSFTPTILMAAIPNSVSRRKFGAAFGIVEVTDAVGATIGNLMIGYLRDKTGSYDLDMLVLFSMAIVTFGLSVLLVFQDRQNGWVLSVPSSRARALSMDDDEPVSNPVLQYATSDESISSTGRPAARADNIV